MLSDKGYLYKPTQLPEKVVCQLKTFRSPVLNKVFLEGKAERHKKQDCDFLKKKNASGKVELFRGRKTGEDFIRGCGTNVNS